MLKIWLHFLNFLDFSYIHLGSLSILKFKENWPKSLEIFRAQHPKTHTKEPRNTTTFAFSHLVTLWVLTFHYLYGLPGIDSRYVRVAPCTSEIQKLNLRIQLRLPADVVQILHIELLVHFTLYTNMEHVLSRTVRVLGHSTFLEYKKLKKFFS